jgi:hypothetical protein
MSRNEVDAEWFVDDYEVLTGGVTEGELEAAATLVGWIESGFPNEVWVGTAVSADGQSETYYMRPSTLIDVVDRILVSPLPMPNDLAKCVRRYVVDAGLGEEEFRDERVTWASALYELKFAVARNAENRV